MHKPFWQAFWPPFYPSPQPKPIYGHNKKCIQLCCVHLYYKMSRFVKSVRNNLKLHWSLAPGSGTFLKGWYFLDPYYWRVSVCVMFLRVGQPMQDIVTIVNKVNVVNTINILNIVKRSQSKSRRLKRSQKSSRGIKESQEISWNYKYTIKK